MQNETRQLHSELSKGTIIQIGTIKGKPAFSVLDAATKAIIANGQFAIIKGKLVPLTNTFNGNKAQQKRAIEIAKKRRGLWRHFR